MFLFLLVHSLCLSILVANLFVVLFSDDKNSSAAFLELPEIRNIIQDDETHEFLCPDIRKTQKKSPRYSG
jgi:hypothetical protein